MVKFVKAKEFIPMRMVTSMRVRGSLIQKKVKDIFITIMENFILVIGTAKFIYEYLY